MFRAPSFWERIENVLRCFRHGKGFRFCHCEALFDVAANGFFQSFSSSNSQNQTTSTNVGKLFHFPLAFMKSFPFTLLPPTHFRATRNLLFQMFFLSCNGIIAVIVFHYRKNAFHSFPRPFPEKLLQIHCKSFS